MSIDPLPKVTLVIPCYNEEKRLDFAKFERFRDQINFQFVDDGSLDNTANVIEEHGHNCLRLKKNVGKGMAIRQGLLYLTQQRKKTQTPIQNEEWWGYWDADLSIPLEHLNTMFKVQPNKKTYAIWSSRYKKFIRGSRSSVVRSLLGKLFSGFTRLYFNLNIHDTQCGAKIFRASIIEEVFKEEFISRWFFDIELYFRIPRNSIIEQTVSYWKNHTGSKVSLVRDGLQAFIDLPRIKARYKSLK